MQTHPKAVNRLIHIPAAARAHHAQFFFFTSPQKLATKKNSHGGVYVGRYCGCCTFVMYSPEKARNSPAMLHDFAADEFMMLGALGCSRVTMVSFSFFS